VRRNSRFFARFALLLLLRGHCLGFCGYVASHSSCAVTGPPPWLGTQSSLRCASGSGLGIPCGFGAQTYPGSGLYPGAVSLRWNFQAMLWTAM